MSNNRDPQSYLLAAGGLSLVAAGITYCAVNWDNPPDWWPNRLQPWWNKKEPEQKQTDQYVKHEDEVDAKEPVVKPVLEPVVEPVVEPVEAVPAVAPAAPIKQNKEVTEDLVKPVNVEVNHTKE